MKHALITTFTLLVLVTPAVLAQEAASPASPAAADALELPGTAASTSPAPDEAPTCLVQQQPLEQGGHCEAQCYEEYQQCLIVCSKNPCFVSCETVLGICLDNCDS